MDVNLLQFDEISFLVVKRIPREDQAIYNVLKYSNINMEAWKYEEKQN
jgi:hypothetical protein